MKIQNLRLKRILSFMAVVLVMITIYMFSAQQGEESAKLSGGITNTVIKILFPNFVEMDADTFVTIQSNISYIVRKTAHFSEYAILGLAIANLIHQYEIRFQNLISWIAGTLYACTDEYHQSFVAGRGPSIRDVGIDSIGVLFGIFAVYMLLRWIVGRKMVYI